MALLSVIVRQAQYSGERSITNEFRTYVTLTLDRCRTKTSAVKGHNPHWEQDYLFETQSTSRGLLMEVWRQDEYGHFPIGCYWLPLNLVRYSNEHTTGLWASLGKELTVEDDNSIIKSTNATGHFLLYDARFEDPDERRAEHLLCDNENVDDQYTNSAVTRPTIESFSDNTSAMPVPNNHGYSDKWYKWDNNYREQDGYRSSSSENMRSDLDYSYSEQSNPADRPSFYESSDKSDEKDGHYNQDHKSDAYFGNSSYNHHDHQHDRYHPKTQNYKRSEYDNQIDDEQWVSDDYVHEQDDELIYENNRDYNDREDHDYPGSCNEDEDGDYEDLDGEYAGEMEDEEYYPNDEYNPKVITPPPKKRILPKIPTQEVRRLPKIPQNNYLYDQYKDRNHISESFPRVPSIYVDSPTLSPCLSVSKGKTAFEFRNPLGENSASGYQYPNNSVTARHNQKTFSNNYAKMNSVQRYPCDDNYINQIDDYDSNEEDGEDYEEYPPYDYYRYEDDIRSNEHRDMDGEREDDINNNQLVNNRGIRDYGKNSCSQFTKTESPKEVRESARRQAFQERGKAPTLTRQDESLCEPFEVTYNELPDDEYGHYDIDGDKGRKSLPSIHPQRGQVNAYYKQFGSIVEEGDYHDEDDATIVSPVNSSSLSQRSPNFASPDKDGGSLINSYHETDIKTPASEEDEHTPENEYISSYRNSLIEKMLDRQPSLQPEASLEDGENCYLAEPVVIGTESRKPSLKEENSIEVRRQKARDRWHNAYNKIIHQLSIAS